MNGNVILWYSNEKNMDGFGRENASCIGDAISTAALYRSKRIFDTL